MNRLVVKGEPTNRIYIQELAIAKQSFKPKKTIRIVCLHPFSNENSANEEMHQRMGPLMELLGCDFEFVFLEFNKSRYFKGWYTPFFATDKEIDTTLALIHEELVAIGDIDGILGFSMGATICELLDRFSELQKIKKVWKFSVLLSGIPLGRANQFLLNKEYVSYAKMSDAVAVVVNDTIENQFTVEPMFERYKEAKKCEYVEHPLGHLIPKDEVVASGIARKILNVCQFVGL